MLSFVCVQATGSTGSLGIDCFELYEWEPSDFLHPKKRLKVSNLECIMFQELERVYLGLRSCMINDDLFVIIAT